MVVTNRMVEKPKVTPVSPWAILAASTVMNSIKAYLEGWLISPHKRNWTTGPQMLKNWRTCSSGICWVHAHAVISKISWTANMAWRPSGLPRGLFLKHKRYGRFSLEGCLVVIHKRYMHSCASYWYTSCLSVIPRQHTQRTNRQVLVVPFKQTSWWYLFKEQTQGCVRNKNLIFLSILGDLLCNFWLHVFLHWIWYKFVWPTRRQTNSSPA